MPYAPSGSNRNKPTNQTDEKIAFEVMVFWDMTPYNLVACTVLDIHAVDPRRP
jgi:hypothetical protein